MPLKSILFIFRTLTDTKDYFNSCTCNILTCTYLIFVIFFTQAKFLENEIYTEKRVNYTVDCQFFVNYTVNCRNP